MIFESMMRKNSFTWHFCRTLFSEYFLNINLFYFEYTFYDIQACRANPAIENFIRNRAIDFARRKLSVTYLLNDFDDDKILGYFALTHKAVLISNSQLSNTSRKKLERFARLDKATGDYMASAFLIAQFGKNYGVDGGKRITRKQLMDVANDVLVNIQRQIGGGIIYLDCEDIEKLKILALR